MNTHNTRTYYLRSIPRQGQKRGDPIACLMTSLDRAGNVIKYSIATMHPKDEFKKALGRKIAEGRLQDSPAIVFVEKMPESGHVISRMIMNDILARFEEVSCLSKGYLERQYKNKWAYHIPARVAKAAKQWIANADKPRQIDTRGKTHVQIMTEIVDRMYPRVSTQKDLTGSCTGSITCDIKDAPAFTEADLSSKNNESVSLQMSRPTVVSNPKDLIKYGDSNEFAEWVKAGQDFVREPAREDSAQVKKTPKYSFSNAQQQANYEVFQKALPDMLMNKFLKGRYAIVSGNEIKSFFDSYQTSLEHALVKYKAGEFIIQEVAVNVMPIYEQKSA